MGKLMRIGLDPNLPAGTPNLAALKTEAAVYDAFKQRVLAYGLTETFRELCFLQVAEDLKLQTVQAYPQDLQLLGQARLKNGKEFCLLAGKNLAQWQKQEETESSHAQGSVALWLSSKLNWQVLQKDEHGWKVVGSGEKPDSAYDKIGELLGSK
jgi:hypothetical protein